MSLYPHASGYLGSSRMKGRTLHDIFYLFLFFLKFLPGFLFPIITLSHITFCLTLFKRLATSYRLRSHLSRLWKSCIIFLWPHLPPFSASCVVLDADSWHSGFFGFLAPLARHAPSSHPLTQINSLCWFTACPLPRWGNTAIFQFPPPSFMFYVRHHAYWKHGQSLFPLHYQSLTHSRYLANVKTEKERGPEYTQGSHTF